MNEIIYRIVQALDGTYRLRSENKDSGKVLAYIVIGCSSIFALKREVVATTGIDAQGFSAIWARYTAELNVIGG